MEITDAAKKLLKNLTLYNNGLDEPSICTKKEMRKTAYSDYCNRNHYDAESFNKILSKIRLKKEQKEQIEEWIDSILTDDYFCCDLLEPLADADGYAFAALDFKALDDYLES